MMIYNELMFPNTVEPLFNGHAPLGNNVFAFIQRWPLLRGCFVTNCSFGTWVPGRYIAAGLYLEVIVNRGSTVQC